MSNFRKVNIFKRILSILFDLSGGFSLFQFYLKIKQPQGHIRVVNYHGTPAFDQDILSSHFAFYAKYYSPVSENDLKEFFKTGCWKKGKPGIIISFDDGLLSNYDVAGPLLEKFDLVGWFFIPTGFVDTDIPGQWDFLNQANIQTISRGPKLAMDWDQLRDLSKSHVVGAHSVHHVRLKEELGEERLRKEIFESKMRLELELSKNISSFCWVGGEEYAYSQTGARLVKEAGYEFSFMTNSFPIFAGQSPFQIQRSNIESHWSLSLVKFQLGGILDWKFKEKRNRVNELTAQKGEA